VSGPRRRHAGFPGILLFIDPHGANRSNRFFSDLEGAGGLQDGPKNPVAAKKTIATADTPLTQPPGNICLSG
jgi:hypothetical protein